LDYVRLDYVRLDYLRLVKMAHDFDQSYVRYKGSLLNCI